MEWFFLAFISALLSAAAAVSQKKVLFELDALNFSFVLSILNMVFSLVFFFFVDFSTITLSSILVLYGKTVLGALAFYCVMMAIKNMEISGALPLLILTPGFVAFFAFIILGEALSAAEIAGMIALLIGTYIIEAHKSKDIFSPFKVFIKSKFHHYIISALLLFTATSIIDKILLKNYSLHPYALMGFQQLFLAFNFLVILLILKRPILQTIKLTLKKNYSWIILISIVTIGYRYTQIEAIKLAPVALVLSVKRFSVLFATILGGQLFKEQNLVRKVIATIILIAGAILILNG